MKKLIRNLVDDFVRRPLESLEALALVLFMAAATTILILTIIKIIANF